MEYQRKIPASVFILTKNSAGTIGRALESVRDFADIVVCDGGSSDATLEIARAAGARIFRQPDDCIERGAIKDFSCVRNECLAHTVYDWVFYIDSDEIASDALIQEIRAVVMNSSPLFLAYQVPSRICITEEPAREIAHSSSYPGYQIRFFNKKTGARFFKPVHERVRFDMERFPVGTFAGPWFYFVKRDGSDYESDFPLYVGLALERYRGRSFQDRMAGAARACITAGKIFIKALLQYGLYGFRHSIPPRIEYLRIKYQLLLARHILWP